MISRTRAPLWLDRALVTTSAVIIVVESMLYMILSMREINAYCRARLTSDIKGSTVAI